jgi:hypothetical protein
MDLSSEKSDVDLIADFFRKFPIKNNIDKAIAHYEHTEHLVIALRVANRYRYWVRFNLLCAIFGFKSGEIPQDYFQGYFHFREDCLSRFNLEYQDEATGEIKFKKIETKRFTLPTNEWKKRYIEQGAKIPSSIPCPNCTEHILINIAKDLGESF